MGGDNACNFRGYLFRMISDSPASPPLPRSSLRTEEITRLAERAAAGDGSLVWVDRDLLTRIVSDYRRAVSTAIFGSKRIPMSKTDRIIEAVAAFFGVTTDRLVVSFNRSRPDHEGHRMRYICMWVLKQMMGKEIAYADMGRRLKLYRAAAHRAVRRVESTPALLEVAERALLAARRRVPR